MAVDRRRAPVELRSGLRPVDYYNNLQRATRAIYNERSEVIYSEATAKRSKTLELEVDERLHIGSYELIYAHNR